MRWVLLILSLLCFTPAHAWNTLGHKVIAEMAYQKLNEQTRQEVLRLAKIPVPYAPKTRYFYNISYWADRLPQHGQLQYRHWHYIDLPYEQGVLGKQPDHENVVWALEQQWNILKNRDYSDEQRAIALRWVVHLVADIHQPLHCVSLYHPDFPHGDQGGNLFRIPLPSVHYNLHALWDGGGGLYLGKHRNIKKREVVDLAERMNGHFHQSVDERFNPQGWALESHQLSLSKVYTVRPGEPVTTEYIQQVQRVSGEQSFRAGVRLAALLNTL